MQPLFGHEIDTPSSHPLTVQDLKPGDRRLIHEYKRLDDAGETVYLLRLVTTQWEVNTTITGWIDYFLSGVRDPTGILIPSRVREEGYGVTSLAWVPEEERAFLISVVQELQDSEHAQSYEEILEKYDRY